MKIANPNVLRILDIEGKLLTSPDKLHTTQKDRSSEFDSDYLRHLIMNDELIRFYKSAIWLKVRQDILERDKWECQLCKTRGGFTILRKNAFIHHMAELKTFPETCLKYDNLVTLCFNCHEETHERISMRPIVEQTFENFDSSERW